MADSTSGQGSLGLCLGCRRVQRPQGEDGKLRALVVIGVNERGEKHSLAIEDGVRESTLIWREVLLKLKSRGMNVPELAVGDGAMASGRLWKRSIRTADSGGAGCKRP